MLYANAAISQIRKFLLFCETFLLYRNLTRYLYPGLTSKFYWTIRSAAAVRWDIFSDSNVRRGQRSICFS